MLNSNKLPPFNNKGQNSNNEKHYEKIIISNEHSCLSSIHKTSWSILTNNLTYTDEVLNEVRGSEVGVNVEEHEKSVKGVWKIPVEVDEEAHSDDHVDDDPD